MGLFNKRKIKKAAKAIMQDVIEAGGNFGYIAQNVATIYLCVKDYAEDCKLKTETEMLLATALIDSYPYIYSRSLDIVTIAEAINKAKNNELGKYHIIQKDSSYSNDCINTILLSLTAQLEVLFFSVDTPSVSLSQIISEVIQHKGQICDMINKTLNEGKKCKFYWDIRPNVAAHVCDPEFITVLKSLIEIIEMEEKYL